MALFDFDSFIDWCRENRWGAAFIISAVLIQMIISIWIFASVNTGTTSNNNTVALPEYNTIESPPPPQPSDTSLSVAYDLGMQAGQFINESVDILSDLWQGFNETTGASVWAREQWESGKNLVNSWIDENLTFTENPNNDTPDSTDNDTPGPTNLETYTADTKYTIN